MLVRAIKEVKSISEVPSVALANRVLFGSKLREARLITNLLRVKYLMQFIGVEKRYILQIEKLSSAMIKQDWPELITDDLCKFLDEINTSMHLFNHNQKSHSNY
ncbi:MAG TPA: hypothetical protein EYN78_08405 [Candidatus Poseidoniales archaeon]|nr:hypothetical protein [Candidatus Poseidoniales archaeon]